MLTRKFVKEGKKFVKLENPVTGQVIEAELAPREVIDEISKQYEVKLEYNFSVEPAEVKPHDKVNLSGYFEAPDREGEYEIDITIRTKGYSHMLPSVVKFQVKKEELVIFTAQEIIQIVNQTFGERAKGCDFKLPDAKYYGAKLADIQAVLQQTKINRLPYIIEEETGVEAYDCDNYSSALMGAFQCDPYKPEWRPTGKQAVFECWVWWKQNNKVYGHALNCAILENRKFIFIEPQNYRIFDVPENWHIFYMGR